MKKGSQKYKKFQKNFFIYNIIASLLQKFNSKRKKFVLIMQTRDNSMRKYRLGTRGLTRKLPMGNIIPTSTAGTRPPRNGEERLREEISNGAHDHPRIRGKNSNRRISRVNFLPTTPAFGERTLEL
jgi:hypothetical protein